MMMEEPLLIWLCFWLYIWGLCSTSATVVAFFFESEYSPKDPRTGIFYLLRAASTGLDADLSK